MSLIDRIRHLHQIKAVMSFTFSAISSELYRKRLEVFLLTRDLQLVTIHLVLVLQGEQVTVISSEHTF
ncbi:hypothetical protein GIB67_037347 [Kingdonia uniflora]|uniref:Uncharacterized protein n=1 Tax=Kingdonia uniflora TaxID=39325 RepID=A0A7J7KY27_9MAGN|nr:hypothetical protein GIB67_037347 [Kingdonia uniflora]